MVATMRWGVKTMTWLSSALGSGRPAVRDDHACRAPQPVAETAVKTTEKIRRAMLATLDDGPQAQFTSLTRRIVFTQDTWQLWYLRSDLMNALAATAGEAAAREQMHRITTLFRDVLPDGLASALRTQ
jgi:hypothetical protein